MRDQTFLKKRLSQREAANALRQLSILPGLIDFCSNDYLGLARSETLQAHIREQMQSTVSAGNGSTGSRLISGNSRLCETLEHRIAEFHQAESALIFNSGYDANLGLFATIPQRGDTVLYDELAHASIRDGIRLGFARAFSFSHNDLNELERKLQRAKGQKFVAVESIYSMDGDEAPLAELATLCEQHGAHLIVDEAHATGIFGPHGSGCICEQGLAERVFARVHTFGKALGTHGAAVVGSRLLRSTLVNFARSFIYTTFLPPHSLVSIRSAYEHLLQANEARQTLQNRISSYRAHLPDFDGCRALPSRSAIQSLIVPGNERVKTIALHLQKSGYDVRPILSPTVPKGRERLRICLHAFNTREEISGLLASLKTNNRLSSAA